MLFSGTGFSREWTRSVLGCIPTQSVGTIVRSTASRLKPVLQSAPIAQSRLIPLDACDFLVGPALAGKRPVCALVVLQTAPFPVGASLLANAVAVLLIFLHKRSRHRKTRLWCRPSAGDAEWVEPHGCGESAVRTWMSVRRGPTEHRRSEGTRRSRAQPGAGTFAYFWCFSKVSRRRRNSSAVRQSHNNDQNGAGHSNRTRSPVPGWVNASMLACRHNRG